jgi:hypothetical protein
MVDLRIACNRIVIPAKAGIQQNRMAKYLLDSRFRGNDAGIESGQHRVIGNAGRSIDTLDGPHEDFACL